MSVAHGHRFEMGHRRSIPPGIMNLSTSQLDRRTVLVSRHWLVFPSHAPSESQSKPFAPRAFAAAAAGGSAPPSLSAPQEQKRAEGDENDEGDQAPEQTPEAGFGAFDLGNARLVGAGRWAVAVCGLRACRIALLW